MNKYLDAGRVVSGFFRSYKKLKKYLPIRPSEMGVLSFIGKSDGDVTPLTLSETMGVSKPMIAAHIQTLLERGYIIKEASPEDGRSFFVRPTQEGITLIKEFERRQTEYLSSLEAQLGIAEFDTLIELMGRAQLILCAMGEESIAEPKGEKDV